MRSSGLSPKRVAHLHLNAGIDAWIAIAQRGGRNVHGIDTQVYRLPGSREVVNPNAALGREVPYAGSAVNPVEAEQIGRELVGGIDKAACTLEPWLNPRRSSEKIPAKDDRGQADAAKSAAANRQKTAYRLPARTRADVFLLMGGGGVSLPQRHDIAAKFELARENARMHDRGKRLAKLEPSPKELEI